MPRPWNPQNDRDYSRGVFAVHEDESYRNSDIINQEAKRLWDCAERMIADIKAENRDATPAEARVHRELLNSIDQLCEIPVNNNGPRVTGGPSSGRPQQSQQGTGPMYRAQYGSMMRALASTDKLSDRLPKGQRAEDAAPLGDIVRSLLLGEPSDRIRMSIGGSDDKGGFLLTPSVSSRVIDLARSASVCLKAGATTLPIGGETRLCRVVSDPSSYWRHEAVSVTASEPSFDAVTLRPRTLACIVPISIELLEDSSNIASILETVIANRMAQQIDEACLTGSGAGAEPLGLVGTTGVGSQTSVGVPAYSDITQAVLNVLTANYDREISELTLISHPTNFATLNALQDTTNQPMQPDAWSSQVRKLNTTALSASYMCLGDFTQMLIGMRTNISLRVLESGSVVDGNSVTINATSQLLKLLVAYCRMDVAILRPSWFSVMSGVTTS